LAALAGGCLLPESRRKTERSSSVVAYLYPNQSNPVPPKEIPVLRLPLRVGIAFVPSGLGRAGGSYRGPGDVSETQKTTVLQRVAAEFKGLEYIESIEVVPSTYLRPAGGFENLGQLRRMLNFDVVALVAYDQVQFTDSNFLSLAYWTIVGAYVFHGNKNDTQTLLETAVYDIRSRHLLFRAPGVSEVKGGAAIVYVGEKLREDASKGFDAATNDLIKNLKTQLEEFRTRVKTAPNTVARIEHKPGYRGGGDLGGLFAAALAALTGVWWLSSRRRRVRRKISRQPGAPRGHSPGPRSRSSWVRWRSPGCRANTWCSTGRKSPLVNGGGCGRGNLPTSAWVTWPGIWQ
jgi:rhombotail lipoprotein